MVARGGVTPVTLPVTCGPTLFLNEQTKSNQSINCIRHPAGDDMAERPSPDNSYRKGELRNTMSVSMSSEKQQAANRANAQLSTGPVTPEGKLTSSLNGTTHGLAAARISPRDLEGQARRAALIAAYTDHYRPANQVEADAVVDLAAARTRIEKIEDALADTPIMNIYDTGCFALLMRYLREARRVYERARKLLEEARMVPDRQDLAQAAAQTRIVAMEMRADEPLRSELASLRRELFTSWRQARRRRSCDPAQPSTPPSPAPSSTPM
jgi:hypothetical protein